MHVQEILPGFPAGVVRDYVEPLVEARLIRAGERQDFSELEAEIVRTYARMIRVEGHPPEQALGLTVARFRGAVTASQEAEPVFPFPAGIPVSSAMVAPTGQVPAEIMNAPSLTPAAFFFGPQRKANAAATAAPLPAPADKTAGAPPRTIPGSAVLEAAAAAKLARISAEKEAAERREHIIMTEMAAVRARFERFREETATLRKELDEQRAAMIAEQHAALERIRDLDEERNKSRFRIARIETAIRGSVRKNGFWERLKAAFGVLLGNATIVPLLPESIDRAETSEEIPLEKAA
jgi:hypothetical protein